MKYLIVLLSMCSIGYSLDSRTRIAVIDTGIFPNELTMYLCDSGHKDFTNTTLDDTDGHGTYIASIITQGMNPNKECLVIIKYWKPHTYNFEPMLSSLKYAIVDQRVSYINISGGGEESNPIEKSWINFAVTHDINVVVAAGNNSKNLSKSCDFYPACYSFHNPNFYVVGSITETNGVSGYSNFNGPVNEYELGSLCVELSKDFPFLKCHHGTSGATALFTSKLIKKNSKK